MTNIIEVAVSYLESIPGFAVEQTNGNTLKISAVYLIGTVSFWPTTGSFRFSNPRDCSNMIYSSDRISLVELIEAIKVSNKD